MEVIAALVFSIFIICIFFTLAIAAQIKLGLSYTKVFLGLQLTFIGFCIAMIHIT